MVENKPDNETQKTETRLSIRANERGLVLQSLNDMYRFAQYVVASRLVPSSFTTAEQVIIAIQSGAELGLPPMRALGSFCVVKGLARLWGDAPLALVRQSGQLDYIKESIEGEIGKDFTKTPDNVKAICITKRKGDPEEVITEFSVAEARQAGLWGKTGTWTTHPQRMLKYKARSFNLRDNFPDAFGGATIAEEYEGIEMVTVPLNDKPKSAALLEERQPKQNVDEILDADTESEKLSEESKPEQITIEEAEKHAKEKLSDYLYRCLNPTCDYRFDKPGGSKRLPLCPKCLCKNIEKVNDAKAKEKEQTSEEIDAALETAIESEKAETDNES